jgi:hypothetical protein
MGNTFNVFVTGCLYSGKTSLCRSVSDEHHWVDLEEYFGIYNYLLTPQNQLNKNLDLASASVSGNTINLFTHGGSIHYIGFWELIGDDCQGAMLIVDIPLITLSQWRDAALDEYQQMLNYFRIYGAGKYVLVANKLDLCEGSEQQGLDNCRSLLDLRPDELLVPCVATDPARVHSVLEALIDHLQSR